MTRKSILYLLLPITLSWFIASVTFAATLVVIEQDDCPYCHKFHDEIAQAYPKTTEGKLAPLRILDLHEPWPEDLSNIEIQRFTPTFILVENGREVDRLIGYPGDEHFWFLLGEMLGKLEGNQ